MGRRSRGASSLSPLDASRPGVSPAVSAGSRLGVTTRRIVLSVGVIALLIGFVALLVPVSTSDGNGGNINCGNGLSSDVSAARDANNNSVAGVPILNQVVPHNDYVAQCESKLSSRRAWTIPLALLGAVAAGGSMLVGGRTGADQRR